MNLPILMPLRFTRLAEFEPAAFDGRWQEHLELIVKLIVGDADELRPLILAFGDHFHDAESGHVAILVALFPQVGVFHPLAAAGGIVIVGFEPEVGDGGVGGEFCGGSGCGSCVVGAAA